MNNRTPNRTPLAEWDVEDFPRDRHKQVVYYLGGTGLGVVKIGTTNNLRTRIKAIQRTATGLNPVLIGWEYGGEATARERYRQFWEDSLIRGDWFVLTPRVWRHISSINMLGFPEADPQ